MPRKPNVSMQQIEDLVDGLLVHSQEISDMAKSIDLGYCAKLQNPIGKLTGLNGIIQAAAELQRAILMRAMVQETAEEFKKKLAAETVQ